MYCFQLYLPKCFTEIPAQSFCVAFSIIHTSYIIIIIIIVHSILYARTCFWRVVACERFMWETGLTSYRGVTSSSGSRSEMSVTLVSIFCAHHYYNDAHSTPAHQNIKPEGGYSGVVDVTSITGCVGVSYIPCKCVWVCRGGRGLLSI